MDKGVYEKIQKKYNLPNFQKLDAEFDLTVIQETDKPAYRILQRIQERIDFYIGILRTILQPDPSSFPELYECRYFTDDDKAEVFATFKELMILDRSLVEANLLLDEKVQAARIKECYETMSKMKQRIVPWVERMKSCWKRATEKQEILEYLG